MQQYIGVKIVNMKPMTRQEYNDFRGWKLPDDECGTDAGYLVEYTDGGKPNMPGFDGYVSWSPKEQADAAYRVTDGLTFGLAIEAMKKGKRVSRAGWNGKGMFVAIQPGCTIPKEFARGGVAKYLAEDGVESIVILPHVDMKAADGSVVVGWLASQTDMLAEDWQIVE
jgi:hypothetical protein